MTAELTRLLVLVLLFAMLGYSIAALIIVAMFKPPSRVPSPPLPKRKR